ncbi:restriction endonuclease subunit S [Streptomyces sp. NPDC127114]|uniref:restriction endonuclease subunit S n=1 Tax=Streptomyces sp. NPDC127114 TaxID=3345366 RepID=UPI0036377088
MSTVLPVKRLASVTLGKMVQPDPKSPSDISAPYLRAAHVQPQGKIINLPEQPMWFHPSELRALDLRRGDVVIVEGGAGYGRSAVVREDLPGWGFQNSIIRLRPLSGRADGRFLDYALQDALTRGRVDLVTSTATIPHFTADKVSKFEVPAPALVEQRAIADFLDRETGQIDALVSKQEEFVALLRERRSVVVSEILSRAEEDGNPPDKLHRRTRMGNGSTPRSSEDRYWVDGEVPWVNSSVVNLPEVREPSRRVTKAAVLECHLPIVSPGSILVALTGQGKTRGAATILRIESTINQHLAYIEPDKRYWVPEYLLWSLRSNYEYLRRISSENGATKGGLTVGDLRALRLAMPPVHKQHQLLAEVAAATERVDSLIAKAREHIMFTKERRAALITAAVGGQIDARTFQKAG